MSEHFKLLYTGELNGDYMINGEIPLLQESCEYLKGKIKRNTLILVFQKGKNKSLSSFLGTHKVRGRVTDEKDGQKYLKISCKEYFLVELKKLLIKCNKDEKKLINNLTKNKMSSFLDISDNYDTLVKKLKDNYSDEDDSNEDDDSDEGDDDGIDLENILNIARRGFVPILIKPCNHLNLEEEGLNEFIKHYGFCSRCKVINNNNKELGVFLSLKNCEVEFTKVNDIDDEIENIIYHYDSCKHYQPCNVSGNLYSHIYHLKDIKHYMNNHILVAWTDTNLSSSQFISQLSKEDKQLIDEAILKYKIEKSEIYGIE